MIFSEVSTEKLLTDTMKQKNEKTLVILIIIINKICPH